MRQVHILDPQLQNQGGHYLNHDAQLVRELKARGIPVTLWARRGCQVTCEGLTPQQVFSHDIFQEAGKDPEVWAIENFHTLNQAFLADLAQIDTARLSAEDLLYFPNLLQNQTYAIAMWLGRLPAERRPTVAIMYRYLNHAMDYVQNRKNKDLIAHFYRYAVRQLIAAHPRTVICADTTELAKAYREITGVPVIELPNPMDVSELLKVAGARPANDRPVVVYQGHTSPLRGFHFLPEIIEHCAKLPSRPRFVVQVQNREMAVSLAGGEVMRRLEALVGDNLRLVPGALSSADYLDLLAGADIVLLPYTPTFYGYGSSGVFTEAASLGKAVVVSPNTVPARQGREYHLGVVAAQEWSPKAMAAAVVAAISSLPEQRAKAARGAPKFRADQCAKNFWDRLLAAVNIVSAPRATAA